MNLQSKPILRYIGPFIAFMLFTELQRFGDPLSVFWIYGAKTILCSIFVFILFKSNFSEIIGKFDIKAVALGLLVLILWIAPWPWVPTHQEALFNPTKFQGSLAVYPAVILRIIGASLLVPVLEELMWRSFLMRYLIDQNFLKVPLGKYTHLSFWGTIIAFMLVHQSWEWPMAFITGMLYGGYLVKTKNLVGCIIAHATTNLALAGYVLITQKWYYW